MRRISPGCCPRAASGQAATPLPTSAMNSRRFIDAPEAQNGKRRTSRALFDHTVGTLLQLQRDGEAQRLRRLEIDHKVILRRRLHGQIARLFTLENAVNI